ncbi:hypothetical protein BDR03DRAFT_972647 [Suillus americanus]|nr:hypothetical protein BDR03DRAFT_972647 [Suillus americanus]
MNNLQVNVQRASSANNSTIPPTPTIIVSETVVHSPTLNTTEERFRKELELDRKDAECELSRYEDTSDLKQLNVQQISFVSRSKRTYISASIPRRYGSQAAFRAHIFIQ